MPGPVLAREDSAWTGTFPGLGTVAVAPGGEVVTRSDGLDEGGSRSLALRHGWGDLLDFARRGFSLANAAAVSAGERGLLVTGEPDDVATALLGLAQRGFLVVSDRPAPTQWADGSLVAHPREAPILVPQRRAERAGLDGTPVCEGSTSVAVNLPRGLEPVRVVAIAHVTRQRPDEEALDHLAGTRRFERAATLMLRGALAPAGPDEPDPQEVFDEHLRLAALPSVVIRMEGRDDAQAADWLAEWWGSTVDAAT